MHVGRHVPNMPDVIAALQRRFPSAWVQMLWLEEASLEAQIRLMQGAAALVAVSGAAMDNAMFLRDGSGLVVLSRSVWV